MNAGRFPTRNYTPAPRKHERPAAETAWEQQADWYDQVVGEDGDDFYRHLILPTVLRRLAAKPGETILDIGCGQGVLGRVLATGKVKTLGVDASPALIEKARGRAGEQERHVVGDVRRLDAVIPGELVDHAAAVLSLQDLDPLPPVLEGVAVVVRPGGRLVIVLTHPCFRVPERVGLVDVRPREGVGAGRGHVAYLVGVEWHVRVVEAEACIDARRG